VAPGGERRGGTVTYLGGATMENIGRRIACAVVAAAISVIISFALLYWIESPPLAMFIAIPVACAVAGFVGGDKAVEVFKHIAQWI
jgi:hypothetical protein